MFTIYGGKTEFKQWEQGQRVTNPKLAVGDKVRFWNQSGETHPMIAYKHEGVVVADVPNDLLQHCSPILVELCGDPECMSRFVVTAQDKPADYEFIDNTHCASAPSGGVSSWNDLTDKPFDEKTTTVQGDTLTWDGNTEGKEIFNLGEASWVKVSDAVPSPDEFKGAYGTAFSNEYGNDTYEYDAEYVESAISRMPVDSLFFLDYTMVVYAGNTDIDGISLPSSGTYFKSVNDGDYALHTASLTIPGYTGFVTTETVVQTIDPKFLPEGYPRAVKAELLPEITAAVDPDNDYMGMLPDVVDVQVGQTYTVRWNGKDYICTAQAFDMDGLLMSALGDLGLMTGGESTGEPFAIVLIDAATAALAGVGVQVYALDGSTTATFSITGEVVDTLDAKFLPNVSDLPASWIAELKTALGIG